MIRPLRRSVLLLGTICLVEAAALSWRATALIQEIALPELAATPKPVEIARLLPQSAPAPQEFAEVSARPLFRPGRRPQPVAVASSPVPVAAPTLPPTPPPVTPPSLTLLGVVLSPAGSRAMIRLQGAQSVQTVQIGDDLRGWRVQTIEPERIQLRNGKVDYEVPLRTPVNRRAGEGVIVHPAPATARPDLPKRLPVPLAR